MSHGKQQRYPHYPNRNYHHHEIYSVSGDNSPANLLLIDIEKHISWHKLFGNRNIDEVIKLLKRLRRLKKRLR